MRDKETLQEIRDILIHRYVECSGPDLEGMGGYLAGLKFSIHTAEKLLGVPNKKRWEPKLTP